MRRTIVQLLLATCLGGGICLAEDPQPSGDNPDAIPEPTPGSTEKQLGGTTGTDTGSSTGSRPRSRKALRRSLGTGISDDTNNSGTSGANGHYLDDGSSGGSPFPRDFDR